MSVILHEIPGSPNNVKVRIAMNYKEIPFERRPITMTPPKPPSEWPRQQVVESSGQPFTPTIQHDNVTMFDSSSILRYLEANFRGTRPLFSSDYNKMREIETWENFGRFEMSQCLRPMFPLALTGQVEADAIDEGNRLYEAASAKVEEQLGKTRFLCGDDMTAADVVVAPYASFAHMSEEQANHSPIARFFHDHLKMPASREKTKAWIEKVMSFDR